MTELAEFKQVPYADEVVKRAVLTNSGTYFDHSDVNFPIYFLGGAMENENKFEYYATSKRAGLISLTRSQIEEVIDVYSRPFTFKYKEKTYIGAKGLLAELTKDGQIEVLYIERMEDWVDTRDLTVSYVKTDALSGDLGAVLRRLISSLPGEIRVQKNISGAFARKPEMPAFRTIGEKKRYIEDLLKSALDEL